MLHPTAAPLGSVAGLLSPTGPGLPFYVVVLLVAVPAVGLLEGTLAAAVSLPYVYHEGGWLFARQTDRGEPSPAPLKHLVVWLLGTAFGV